VSFLADENFPRPALELLRSAGWDVLSIAEERPGIPDEEVIALCMRRNRVLLMFDKDFGELVFLHGLPANCGVVLFRVTPGDPEEAAALALALIQSKSDLNRSFCVVTRERVRVRPLRPSLGVPKNH
jgi:predicted nuclease of predicted toxin-antitoxin system